MSLQLPLALETAKHLKAGTVWLNCHNMFDAAAGFGGYKQSGYGRDGGKEGLYEYAKPKWQTHDVKVNADLFSPHDFFFDETVIPTGAESRDGPEEVWRFLRCRSADRQRQQRRQR